MFQVAFTGDFLARFTATELHLFSIPPPDLEVPSDTRIVPPGNGRYIPSNLRFPYPFLQSIGYPEALVYLPLSLPHKGFPITLDTSPPYVDDLATTWRHSLNLTRQNSDNPNPVDVTFDLRMTYSLPLSLGDFNVNDEHCNLAMGYPSTTVVEVYSHALDLAILSVIPPDHRVSYHTTGENAVLTILHIVDERELYILGANT